MAKTTDESCETKCPIYELMECLCGKDTAGSKVLEHFNNARVEVLLGVRELIDGRIEELQKKPKSGKRSRRIKVTEKA
ncbi:hypothetical protein ACFL09_06575 [Planctomycetota bacterium]